MERSAPRYMHVNACYRNFTCNSREVTLPLSLLRPCLEDRVQFLVPPIRKGVDGLERLQWRATKKVKCLGSKTYE